MTYKCTKVKTAIEIIADTDNRTNLGKRFDMLRTKTKLIPVKSLQLRMVEFEYEKDYDKY